MNPTDADYAPETVPTTDMARMLLEGSPQRITRTMSGWTVEERPEDATGCGWFAVKDTGIMVLYGSLHPNRGAAVTTLLTIMDAIGAKE